MYTIDLNCDMGEGFGRYAAGQDAALMPLITSANIACGFHAGDPWHMEQTLKLALAHGVRIGAHPGYPDLAGFGRRRMHLKADELRVVVKYQVAALKGMAESLGGRLAYVKPHGALYNTCAADANETRAVLDALREIDPTLPLMGLAGSTMEAEAAAYGTPFIAEAFADRRYTTTGHLVSRLEPHAVLHDPEAVVAQVVSLVTQQSVTSADGTPVAVAAQSICIHGDNPAAVDLLRALDAAFAAHHIEKRPSPP